MPKEKVTREEIEKRVKKVIGEAANVSPEKLTPNLNLRDDLAIDSFSAIEMIYSAEDEFGISISDEELAKVSTIDDIINIVQQKL